MEHKKLIPMKLRDVGKDELWIQDQIFEDTSILGLGDLVVIQSEKQQLMDGRAELLMYDSKDSIGYKIEIMLGPLDEGYIINSMVYWEAERGRYPALKHRIVIVVEHIATSFFSTIKLINRPVSIIVVQFSVFKDEDQITLRFCNVLDLTETINEEGKEMDEDSSRKYRGPRANFSSNKLLDSMSGAGAATSSPLVLHDNGRVGWGIQ